jgi:hypothetical protein
VLVLAGVRLAGHLVGLVRLSCRRPRTRIRSSKRTRTDHPPLAWRSGRLGPLGRGALWLQAPVAVGRVLGWLGC